MTRILPDDVGTGFSTRAIHAGQRPDPTNGAIMPPIYQTPRDSWAYVDVW